MIKIENIKGFTALNKLRGYEGKNPYLKKLKNELVKNGKLMTVLKIFSCLW